jgi:hypothetical protein
MRTVCLIVACGTALWPLLAGAQEKTDEPHVKLLTPAECANITRRSPDEYYIDGSVTIGVSIWTRSSISRNGMVMNGVDMFDVITRSCYAGKTT